MKTGLDIKFMMIIQMTFLYFKCDFSMCNSYYLIIISIYIVKGNIFEF